MCSPWVKSDVTVCLLLSSIIAVASKGITGVRTKANSFIGVLLILTVGTESSDIVLPFMTYTV